MIPLRNFWAFLNGQFFGAVKIYRPGFVDKSKDQVIS